MRVIEADPEISVVIPAHNEAENLPILIDEILVALRPTGRPFEIVLIDDYSSDRTPTVLARLARQIPELVVRRMKRNGGQSAALSAGFDIARGSIVVTIDADLQNDPADIPAMLDKLDRADIVIGWRAGRKDTFSKRIISKVANAVRNWFTGECVKDTGCGLKVMRAECLAKIPRFNGMHRFFPTLVKMYGYQMAEVVVNHRPRAHGQTHYNIFNRSIRPIMDLLAVRWLQARALRYELEPAASASATVPQVAKERAA